MEVLQIGVLSSLYALSRGLAHSGRFVGVVATIEWALVKPCRI